MQAPPASEAAAATPHLSPDHESAMRRWLALVVERSTLAELAERPLGARVSDARLLLEALDPKEETAPDAAAPAGGLRGRIDALLDAHRRTGEPFAVALVATTRDTPAHTGPRPLDDVGSPALRRFGRQTRPPEAAQERWAAALEEAAGTDELVLAAGHGTAVVLPATSAEDARAAVDRLRVSAWRVIGEEGRLAEAGLACCPEDGTSAHDLLAVAEERLDRAGGRRGDPYDEPVEAPEALRAATALRVLPLR